MSDLLGERMRLANPVPLVALGAIRDETMPEFVAEITNTERRVRTRKRRLVVALLVVLALGAPVALAAARSHLLDFAIGDPAPQKERIQLERMLPPAYGPKEGPPAWRTRNDIISGSERLVDQITTSTGDVARMYAVSLRGGGACWFATGAPFSVGGCGGASIHRTSAIGGTFGIMFAGLGKREQGTFGQGVTLAGPVGARGAVSIRVHYKDGTADTVTVVHGWLMYEVPLRHTQWGHEPTSVEALDAAGRVLARHDDPFELHPPAQPKPEQALKPHHLLARQSLGWHGASLELLLATGNTGNSCIQTRNTGNLFQTRRWLCDPAVGRDTALEQLHPTAARKPVYLEIRTFTDRGRPDGYVYASGWAGPPVTRVEIRYQDSTVQTLPLHRRFFLYVVPRSRFILGKRPSYLIGRTTSGRVVYRRFLYPQARCAYPGPDPRCTNIIVHNG